MSRIQLIVGGRDLTNKHDGLVFSNVDPGGYETLSCNPDLIDGLRAGSIVDVLIGMQRVWYGRINAPGPTAKGGRITNTLDVVGIGAVLSDIPVKRSYIVGDLSVWQDGTAFPAVPLGSGSGRVNPGTSITTTPGAITLTFPKDQSYLQFDKCVLIFDGGPDPYAWAAAVGGGATSSGTHGEWHTYLRNGDTITDAISGVNGSVTTMADGYVGGFGAFFDKPRRFVSLTMETNANVSYTDQSTWITFTGLNIYPLGYQQSVAPIVADMTNAVGLDVIGISDLSGYIIQNLTYKTPTTRAQIIDDVSKLLGASYGTWGPRTIFDRLPTFSFGPPPQTATCMVHQEDCNEVDIPKIQLDQLYDTAIVGYTDAAGVYNTVTVPIANPYIYGDTPHREIFLDNGFSSSGAATVFGNYALNVMQRAARGSGSVTLPEYVMLPGGGVKPAALLRAGMDRIQIIDLPDAGPLHETDTRRFDTFHVRRVETTVQSDGSLSTRVEFDGGADLMEVLNARKAITDLLSGG